MKQNDEDRSWSLYLSSVANPFTEPMSFEEFLNATQKNGAVNSSNEVEQGLNNSQLQLQVKKASNILGGFTPPVGRGC